jgi:hypothetical protein
MTKVFISYRRETGAGEARALFNDLEARLGEGSVFMDVDSIALGRDFRSILQVTLASCDLMLVLIDKNWAEAKDNQGRSRLSNPKDFVRMEVEAALKRNIAVTPILVQGATIPDAVQLPQQIADLAYRNGFEITHNRWESDVKEMIRRLNIAPTGPPQKAADGIREPKAFYKGLLKIGRPPWLGWAIGGAAIAVIALALVLIPQPIEPPVWVAASDGNVPANAVVGGQESSGETLYVCRAIFENAEHGGKVGRLLGGCNIGYGGQEKTLRDYEVLVERRPSTWVTERDGNIPEHAVPVGKELGVQMFVCRGRIENGVHSGKIKPDFHACYIGYDGREEAINPYEVLVTR